MTKDDIIRMGGKAGVSLTEWDGRLEYFERFAALVAEAEAAKWATGSATTDQEIYKHYRRGYEAGKALIPATIEAERKRADALAIEVKKRADQEADMQEQVFADRMEIAIAAERERCEKLATEQAARSEASMLKAKSMKDRDIYSAAAQTAHWIATAIRALK